MRIVAGNFRGRVLKGPASNSIRPTSDRLRESIFNILVHAYGDPITDARVLDLFAGTGALGLEALSRGAKYALFVEEAAEARGLIRENVETLALTGVTRIFRRDASNLGEMGPMEPFNLVFCDPPYGRGLAEKALESLERASGSHLARWLSSKNRRRPVSKHPKVSRSWKGARTTIRRSYLHALFEFNVGRRAFRYRQVSARYM